MDIQRNQPGILARLALFVSKLIPAYSIGPLGLFSVVPRRYFMQKVNLYAPPLEQVPTTEIPDHRTPSGAGNNPDKPLAGAAATPFGRNMPPDTRRTTYTPPPVQIVAAKLLERDSFKSAFPQFNVIAAAWIQAMTHDWMGHFDSDEEITLDQGTHACPMKKFSFHATKRRPDGYFDNFRTHWWDASFVYGQDEAAVKKARTGEKGKMKVSSKVGILPKEDGVSVVGDQKNGWLGVSLLQELFLREHNAVCDAVAEVHPEFTDDKIFNVARLVIAAIAAKIHTVDWTVELLKTGALDVGMNTNWYGLFRALGWTKKGPPGAFALVGMDEPADHGVPYCLTEEFVSVYRMHPLIPDGLPLPSGFVSMTDMVGAPGDDVLEKEGAENVLDAIIKYPCGALVLNNYPRPLRDLAPTDAQGRQLDKHVDLAALDLYRDRERGVKNYNDFRRELHLSPFKSYKDLSDDKDTVAKLTEVYGEGNIEHVDLLIGMLAEKKLKGFAISETAFLIFLLMASRRLEADRFFTKNFDEKTYTDVGFAWVKSVTSLRDVLKRHFPNVEKNIPGDTSAFTPRDAWPAEHVHV